MGISTSTHALVWVPHLNTSDWPMMTNKERIEALENHFELLHSFCRELEMKIAALDTEHADTRREMLLLKNPGKDCEVPAYSLSRSARASINSKSPSLVPRYVT